MLARARVRWAVLVVVYILAQAIVSRVPVVGPLGWMALWPVFRVGLLAAAWTQERGGLPEIRHLFRGFQANIWSLIPIGIVLLIGMTLAVLATGLIDGGELLDGIAGAGKSDEVFAPSSRGEAAMLFGIICALPTLLAVWFAPALIVFQDCGAAQALATSFRGALANWRALIVYVLLLFFYGALLPGFALALITLVAPDETARYVIALVTIVPYWLLFFATQTISEYVAYRDVFHPDEVAAPPESGSSP